MSNYHIAIDRDGNYDLAHYGVPGMKWKNHIYSHNESEQLTGRGRFRGGKSLAAYEASKRRNNTLKTNLIPRQEQPVNTTSYYVPSAIVSKKDAEKKDDEKKESNPRAVSRGVAVREVSAARLRGRALVDSVMKTAASVASSAAKKGQELLDRLFGRKR